MIFGGVRMILLGFHLLNQVPGLNKPWTKYIYIK